MYRIRPIETCWGDEVEVQSDHLFKQIDALLPQEISSRDVFFSQPVALAPLMGIDAFHLTVGSADFPVLFAYRALVEAPNLVLNYLYGESVWTDADFDRMRDEFWGIIDDVIYGRRKGTREVIHYAGAIFIGLLHWMSFESNEQLEFRDCSWGGSEKDAPYIFDNGGQVLSFSRAIRHLSVTNATGSDFLKEIEGRVRPGSVVLVNMEREPLKLKEPIQKRLEKLVQEKECTAICIQPDARYLSGYCVEAVT